MRKKTLEEVRQRGRKLGYEFLDDVYFGNKHKHTWKCPNQHIVLLRYNDFDVAVNRCSSCWSERNGQNRTMDKQDLLNLAASRDFQVCSPSLYKNCMERIAWICNIGHLFWATSNRIQQGDGCGFCGKKHNNIDQYRFIALAKGGVCESTSYEGGKVKLWFRCRLNHRWPANPNDIKSGHWCPECAKTKNKFENTIYAAVLQQYPNAQQNIKGILPSKLLELDVYVPGLGAIECDGGHWHSLDYGPERDARKDKECADRGIRLLRIKYSETNKGRNFTKAINKALEFLKAA